MLALATAVLVILAIPATASAADRAARLTLNAASTACNGFAQADCSYLMARNGNAAAPDPTAPGASAGTFLNLFDLPAPPTVDGRIADDGTFTAPAADVSFPPYSTTLSNDLVGDIAVSISVQSTDAWTGTIDETSGDVSLTAPLQLQFTLSCNPTNALCGGIFGTAGNMGTWQATAKAPAVLTSGHQTAPTPPAGYGPAWLGPDAEDGTPLDPATGAFTVIDNSLELNHLTTASCVDPGSVACSNPTFGGLVVGALNGAIGATTDAGEVPGLDTVPGAIDLRMSFVLAAPPALRASPGALAFPGANPDGSQPLGTASPAQTITVTAFDTGDVPVQAIYTAGGDDADFAPTGASDCGDEVLADASCTLKLRFTPSAIGPRHTTLYARVHDPATDETTTVLLATLTGTGGPAPTGPPGPIGVTGPQGPAGAAAPLPKGSAPTFRARTVVRVSSKGRAVIGRVGCKGGGTCTVTRTSTTLKVGAKRYAVRLSVAKTIGRNKGANVTATFSSAARNALKRTRARAGALTGRIFVSSKNGTKATLHPVALVRAPR